MNTLGTDTINYIRKFCTIREICTECRVSFIIDSDLTCGFYQSYPDGDGFSPLILFTNFDQLVEWINKNPLDLELVGPDEWIKQHATDWFKSVMEKSNVAF